MAGELTSGGGGTDDSRSYWRFAKTDFFPEPSFESWSSYRSALSNTLPRLRDRILHRSTTADELHSLRLESEHSLRRCLTWLDLTLIGFGSVVGSGIYVLTGLQARLHAGPSIPISYLLSALSALLSSAFYSEFAVAVPSAGGSFSFLRIELGDAVAFLAAANILLEALVGAAGLARSWTSYFATLIDRSPDSLRFHATSLPSGFDLLDPLAAAVLLALSTIAIFGTRRTSLLNSLASVIGIAVIAFVIAAGFSKADASNLHPLFPFGFQGTVQAAAVVYWAYTGFDMVATLAEETKNPAKDIPIGLIGSMSAITLVYIAMSLALVMMQRFSNLDPDAAFSVAFAAAGMRWAKYIVALGALKGMTTGMLVGALGQGRYTTQIARAHMIPPYFALVHPKTGTPVYATILVTALSAVIALFSSLDVLAGVTSISTLFIFTLMAVALLVRRYYVEGATPSCDRMKLVGFLALIVGSSVGVSWIWNLGATKWVGYAVAVAVWLLSTMGLAVAVPQRRKAEVWGVPLVPWLPSLSIAMNVLLMGSLGYQAYVRFGICTLVMVVYYVFVGVHATYDTAHARQLEEGKREGEDGS